MIPTPVTRRRTPHPGLHVAIATLAILAAIVLSAVLAQPASAISRKQADEIAMRVLKVEKKKNVILFREPSRLKASTRLGTNALKPASSKRLGRAAWLYWADLAPYALFSHPSELLVIDDKTGRVLQRKRLQWWPLINGAKPRFLRSVGNYNSPKFRAFEKATFPTPKINLKNILKRSLASRSRPTAGAGAEARAPLGAPLPPLTADTFKYDCVLLIGDLTEPLTARDFPAIKKFGEPIGLRSFYANRTGLAPSATRPSRSDEPDGSSEGLKEDMEHLVQQEGCRDVLIFLSGHGQPAARSDNASVTLRGPGRTVQAPALRELVAAFPNVTFKFKVNACYSGRFAEELKTGPADSKALPPNILIVETSSRANEVSYGTANKQFFDRAVTIVRNAIRNGAAGTKKIKTRRDFLKAVNAVAAELRKRAGFVPNPANLSEFVNGNLTGMQSYVTANLLNRSVGSSALATMLKAGNDNAGRADLARALGRTHPVVGENMNPLALEDRLANPDTSCPTIAAVGPIAPSTYELTASGTCSKALVRIEIRGEAAFTVSSAPAGMTVAPGGTSTQILTGSVAGGAQVVFKLQGSWIHPGSKLTVVYTFSDGTVLKEEVVAGSI